MTDNILLKTPLSDAMEGFYSVGMELSPEGFRALYASTRARLELLDKQMIEINRQLNELDRINLLLEVRVDNIVTNVTPLFQRIDSLEEKLRNLEISRNKEVNDLWNRIFLIDEKLSPSEYDEDEDDEPVDSEEYARRLYGTLTDKQRKRLVDGIERLFEDNL